MDRYRILLVALLLWSLAVTLYAATLSLRLAEVAGELRAVKTLLANASKALRSVRKGVETLGNISGTMYVEVEVEPPGTRVRARLWRGATVLDALCSVADVSVRNGTVYSVNGVEGGWRIYVVRGGVRIPVGRPGSFVLKEGDTVVACRGC